MSLAIVEAGKRVRLVNVNVDVSNELYGRLTAMGMLPGVEIEVIRNSLHGPSIISIKGSRITLGHEIAQKIIVT